MKKLSSIFVGSILSFGFAQAGQKYTPWRPVAKLKPVYSNQRISSNTENKDDEVEVIDHDVTLSFPLGKVSEIDPTFCLPDRPGVVPYMYVLTVSLSGSPYTSILADGCSSTTLHPGECCTVKLNFSGPTIGTETATLDVPTDSPLGGEEYGIDRWNFTLKTVEASSKKGPCDQGSIINVAAQTVAEAVDVVGTPFSLYYSTDFASSYIGHDIPSTPSFKSNGLTISAQHFYNVAMSKLYKGTGRVIPTLSSVLTSGDIMVADYEGNEIYIFNSSGKHLETKTFLTGATKYTFGYDGSNRLTSITDAYGNVTTIDRDGSGNLTDIVGPYGQTTTISLNGSGLVSSITNPNSESYAFTYKSGTDLMETFTKPGGQISTMTYDSNGMLTKDLGNGGNYWSFARNLSVDSHPLVKTSKLGRETSYEVDIPSNGLFKSVTTMPSGMEVTHLEGAVNKDTNSIVDTEDTQGDDERFGTIYQRTTQRKLRMNAVDKLTDYGQSVIWPTGVTDPFGFTSITNTATTNSKVTTSTYTASTKTWLSTSPEGATQTTVLDSHEMPTSVQTGSDTATTISYDTNGRVSQSAQGTHNVLNYTYNTAGLLDTVTDALSHVTSYAYDLAGRVTSITLPDSRVIGYGYDDNGNVTSVTPPSRPAHGFSFNAFETLDTYSPPTLTGVSVVNTTYTYNNDKQLTQITRPDSKTAAFTYDATTGLLTTLTLDTGSYSYTYKTNSDQYDIVSSPDGYNNTFSWYGYNLKTDAQKQTSTGNLFGKTTLAYDAEHRVSSRTIQGRSGATTYVRNYSYNDDDQPTQIGDETFTYEYPSGRLSTTTLGTISDARTYDTYGNLATYTATYTPAVGSPTTLYSYTLTRNLMSQITSMSETVLGTTTVWDYIYDSSARLSKVKKNSVIYSSYTYDDNGNRTGGKTAGSSFTATYDDQDRILTYNSRTYSYNENGDIIQYGTGSPYNTYTFDALGKLKAATTGGGASLAYSLDGLGRRIRKTDGGSFKYQYIYETGERIAAHVNNSGVIQKEYVYGVEHSNVPDYMVSGGVNYRIIKDHLGSPRLVVDTTNGTVSQEMDYDDLGNVISDTNPGFQHFGFAGGNYDSQTKLTKFGAREYDARSAGRWMTKDPIGFNGGDTNLYSYTMQDPINYIDSMGLTPNGACVFAFGVGGGIIGGMAGSGPATIPGIMWGFIGGTAVGVLTCPDFSKASPPPPSSNNHPQCDAGGTNGK